MSRSPTAEVTDPNQAYLDAWQNLAVRIQQGQSFSGRERNCCFLNTRGERFADVSAAMGLDLIDDSRAVALVDWDHDGDLDLWLSNRTGPRVKYLENNLIEQPQTVSIRLIGDPSNHCNRDAIGARARITFASTTQEPIVLTRTLYAGDAFLSQSSKWLHFGIPAGATVNSVEIRWPGSTDWTSASGVNGPGRYTVDQSNEIAHIQQDTRNVSLLASSNDLKTESVSTARIVLPEPTIVLPIQYDDLNGSKIEVKASSANRLFVLWAPWCAPCLGELNELSTNVARLVAANIEVIAIDVDTLSEDYKSARAAASKYQTMAKMPFAVGLADEASLTRITGVWQDAMYRKRQPPLPSSFLIDSIGRLRIVYSGPVEVDQLLRDAANFDVSDDEWKRSAIPFAGRSSEDEFVTNPIAIASIYREELQYADATEYLLRYLGNNPIPLDDDDSSEVIKYRRRIADVYHHLGKIAMDEKRFDAAVKYLDQAVESNSEMASAMIDRATCLQQTGDLVGAQRSLDGALRQRPRDADAWNQMGVVCLTLDQIENAADCFERSLKENRRAYSAANNLAWLRATAMSSDLRNGRQALSLAKGLASGPGANRPDVLDTLAAAYAENADFENAIKTADRAIDLAKRQGLSDLAERIQKRLELYRQSKPFREE